ncbi:unnamed protein product [Calypogeia fissa]
MLRHRSSWLRAYYYLRENGSARCCTYGPRNRQYEGAATQHSSTIVGEENDGASAATRRLPPARSRADELQYLMSCRSTFGPVYLKLSLPENLQFRADFPCKGRFYGVPAYQDSDRHSDCETSDMEGDKGSSSLERTDFQSKSMAENSGSGVERNGRSGILAHRRTSSGFSKLKERDWRSRSTGTDLSMLTSQKPTTFYVYKVLNELEDIELAWQFFLWAEQQDGFHHNVQTYNEMIVQLCMAKKFEDVFNLMETMRLNSSFLKNGACSVIMQSLTRELMYEESIRVFEKAKAYGWGVNAMVYNCYLDVLVKAGHFSRLDDTFAQMQSAGCVPTVHTYDILIKGFGKAEKVGKASQFYDEMKAKGWTPTISTYNTLLHALGMAGKTDEALQLFGQMVDSGVGPSLYTYNILKSIFAGDSSARSASDRLTQRKNTDSDHGAITYDSLIPSLCNEQDVDSALQTLREMESRGCIPSMVMYNLVLFSLLKARRVDTVVDLFRTSKGKGFNPDTVSYSTVISVLCRAYRGEEALQLYKDMLAQGLVPGTWLCNILINLLATLGQVDRAWEVFSQIQGTPDGYTYNVLMSTLCNARYPQKVLGWLKRAGITSEVPTTRSQGILSLVQRMKDVTGPDNVMYNTFMRTLCKYGRVDDAHSLLLDMRKNGLVPGLLSYNNVLNLLGKSGQINKAWKLFLQMDTNADLITYSTMIKYLGKAGSFGKAYKLFEEMKSRGIAPNDITYTTLIHSLGKAGRLEDMCSLFEEMQANGCQPSKFTYSSVLHSFAKAGQVDRAYKVFEESIEKGCIPGVYAYNCVLLGYFQANRPDEALNFYHVMKSMGCTANEVTYETLLHGFRKAGLCRLSTSSVRITAKAIKCLSSGSEGGSTVQGVVIDPHANLERSSFFTDASHLIHVNPPKLHYGVCVADLNGDGQDELFVCGFANENLLLKWSGTELVDVATGTPLEDHDRRAIGVAAGDIDGDGQEELYVLNTDTFLGRKQFTDRLFDLKEGSWTDLFSLPMNMDDANMCAGRSVCCVDRFGSGRYGFFVANYGGLMKLFELSEEGFVGDVAIKAGLATYPTGGRSLVSLPLVSHTAMDIFAGIEGGPNFLFCNKADGSGKFVESAATYGLMDPSNHCRGVAVVDATGSGEFGLAVGNWQGQHKLFAPGPGPVGAASFLGFVDANKETGGFQNIAPREMARPSPIRTVIAADFDNDGYEELFFNNMGESNRLFRQDGPGNWVEADIGEAKEPQGLGTGAAVADIDGDGRLELLISHGELRPQPLSLYLPPKNDNGWLRVKPLTKQGAPARGATVQLTDSAGRVQKRAIDAGSGYLCQMEPVAHFGLGQVKGAVRIRVSWPDGASVVHENVSPNVVLTIPYPSSHQVV